MTPDTLEHPEFPPSAFRCTEEGNRVIKRWCEIDEVELENYSYDIPQSVREFRPKVEKEDISIGRTFCGLLRSILP